MKLVEAAQEEADGEFPVEVRKLFRDQMLKIGHEERVRNLYRIKDKLSSKATFLKPNRSQEEYLSTRKGRDIILKSRQMGFTTLSCVRALDKALWEENTATGIMAHLQNIVTTIFEDLVKFTLRWFLKDWGHLYSPTQKADSSTSVSFSDDGLGRSLNSSMRVLFDFRGKTVNFLHVAEAHFTEDKRLLGSLQAVPSNGEVVLESTANGRGGMFYEQWLLWESMAGLAPYKGHFFPWFFQYPEDPESFELPEEAVLTPYETTLTEENGLTRNAIAWRRWCIAANCLNDSEKFDAEYPSNARDAFFSGESQVYPVSLLKMQAKNCRPPLQVGFLLMDGVRPIFHSDDKGTVQVWEKPQPGHQYVIGADPSGGVGKDFAVAYVKDRNSKKIVARIRGQIEPSDFAGELLKLGRYFFSAFICCEENNHGHLVLYKLKEAQYGNLYRRKVLDEMTQKITKKVGFQTTNESKLRITEQFKTSCKDGQVLITDDELINEMSTFVQIAGKTGRTIRREAATGKNDDRVIAACLMEEMDKSRGDINEHEAYDSFPEAVIDPYTGFAS